MPVGVDEIDASPAATVAYFHVVQTPGATAVGHAFGLDPTEDGVKLLIADVKGVVMALCFIPIVKVQCQGVVDLHWCEVPSGSFISQPEDFSEPPGRRFFVPGRYDGVVQSNGHEKPPVPENFPETPALVLLLNSLLHPPLLQILPKRTIPGSGPE